MYEVLGSIPASPSLLLPFMQNLSKRLSFRSRRVPSWIYVFVNLQKLEKTVNKWGCSSVVERMLSMYEVLGSIPISKLLKV